MCFRQKTKTHNGKIGSDSDVNGFYNTYLCGIFLRCDNSFIIIIILSIEYKLLTFKWANQPPANYDLFMECENTGGAGSKQSGNRTQLFTRARLASDDHPCKCIHSFIQQCSVECHVQHQLTHFFGISEQFNGQSIVVRLEFAFFK